jgi:hypothetical protein
MIIVGYNFDAGVGFFVLYHFDFSIRLEVCEWFMASLDWRSPYFDSSRACASA